MGSAKRIQAGHRRRGFRRGARRRARPDRGGSGGHDGSYLVGRGGRAGGSTCDTAPSAEQWGAPRSADDGDAARGRTLARASR
eukprot:74776-Pleurochrysis_carterae.AAC.1